MKSGSPTRGAPVSRVWLSPRSGWPLELIVEMYSSSNTLVTLTCTSSPSSHGEPEKR